MKNGRTTVYNKITSPEKLKQVNPDNIQLENDFLEYLKSVDRSDGTVKQYKADLHIFWCWNLENNNNKPFHRMSKREFSRFQNCAINEWQWSPKRTRRVKATLSSLSNFIENILDDEDEFKNFKSIVRKIESPANVAIREKSVFEEEELQEILDVLVEEKQYMKACCLALAMNNGRRKAELLRFKVSYFNEENLICDGALYKTPEKVKTKGRGSMGKPLTLYTLAKGFKPYLDLWLEERKELGIETDWLFPKRVNGEWIDEPAEETLLSSWANSFSSIADKPFYFHSMRHRFTTKLLESGIPEAVVQSLIGWDSSDMLRIYDDREISDSFALYFGAEGIKQATQSSITDL